ncbi:MAG: hypothetical protein RQ866_08100 [Bacteroidales bacterium]|nr:hypothetical protein [Bacteroidales bacterium]
MKLVKKDNIYIGMILGVVTPIVIFFILWLIMKMLTLYVNDGQTILSAKTMLITSIFLNLVIYVKFIKKDEYDKTGRGILLITFIAVVLYFFFTEL